MKQTTACTVEQLNTWLRVSNPADEVIYWFTERNSRGQIEANNWPYMAAEKAEQAPLIVEAVRDFYNSGMVELVQNRDDRGCHYIAQKRRVHRLPHDPFGY